jgi:hypothetical protein
MLSRDTQKGASAILVTGSLLLLLGMAAFAVDLGAVYAEDRQDQTAADLSVLAGAIEYTGSGGATGARDQVLAFVAANLPTTYTSTEWRAIWMACTDPGMPAGFNASAAPSGWGTTLPCISGDDDEIRVRVPDQLVESVFGRAIGVDEIATRAVAQARTQFIDGVGGVRPFGVLNGLAAGQVCLTTSPPGRVSPPCDGPTSGNFGTLNSQTWGGPNTIVDCGTPGNPELAINIALGVDHLIGLAPSFAGSGGPYGSYPASTTRLDDCTVSGGRAVPSDNSPSMGPVNTMRADTGFSQFHATKAGLISGAAADFPNRIGTVTPLLQQTAGSPSTRLIREKDGPTTYTYEVDNTPLWDYLNGSGVCSQATVAGASSPRAAMNTCLAAVESGSVTGPIFDDSIGSNPRFGWVPQFHFTTWGSGTHWQPILRHRMIYLDTIWFNCNDKYDDNQNDEECGQNTKGLVFVPQGTADESTLQRGNGNAMKKLRLDQLSAFLLPDNAVPESIANRFPGGNRGPFEVQLTQ